MQIEKIVKPEKLILSTSAHLSTEHLPAFIGQAFNDLFTYIDQHEATAIGTPFISYLNLNEHGQAKDELLHVEVGCEIDHEIPSTEKFQCYLLPSYHAVRSLYIGDYDSLAEYYEEMIQSIKEVNGIFTFRSFEYYLTDSSVPLEEQETMIELAYRPKRKHLLNE